MKQLAISFISYVINDPAILVWAATSLLILIAKHPPFIALLEKRLPRTAFVVHAAAALFGDLRAVRAKSLESIRSERTKYLARKLSALSVVFMLGCSPSQIAKAPELCQVPNVKAAFLMARHIISIAETVCGVSNEKVCSEDLPRAKALAEKSDGTLDDACRISKTVDAACGEKCEASVKSIQEIACGD